MHNPNVKVMNAGFYDLGRSDKSKMVDDVGQNVDGSKGNGTNIDRKSTRLNSSHSQQSRMPSSAWKKKNKKEKKKQKQQQQNSLIR